MASTYSALKIELIGTGEQSGTWGTTTNTNLGDAALGEAITGSADVPFSSADVTVTLTDTNSTQSARNLRLNLTGTTGGARSLILGSGCQIEKLYLVNNGCADAITVKNTTGAGIAVPAGKSMFVYNNGTTVVDAVTHATSLTLGSALPVASGGTGSTSTAYASLTTNVTGTLPVANGGTGATSNAGTAFALKGANSDITSITGLTTALTVAQGGTGATSNAGTGFALKGANSDITSLTGLTTALTVAQGGTGAATLTSNNVLIGAGTSAVTFVAPGSSGNILTSNGTTWASTAASGGGSLQTEIFTAPGTWTKPASATQVRVAVIGGGGGAGSPSFGNTGSSGGTSSFGPAVSATGGSGGRGSPAAFGSGGGGTVATGTALKTSHVGIENDFGAQHFLTSGYYGQSAPVGVTTYSTSLRFQAGAYGVSSNFSGGGGGIAMAIVPVSAPVSITVGAGGAQAGGNPSAGGVGGAIVVEYVG